MSLKAIKDLAYRARHGIATTADRLAAVDAEIAALEQAAKILTNDEVKRALSHAPDDVQDTIEWLEAIAKEAE